MLLFFPNVSFTDGVSAGEKEVFTEQIRAQLKFYHATVWGGPLFISAMDAFQYSEYSVIEFITKMPVLVVLLLHVKKSNSVFGYWPLSKKILVSITHVVRGRFTTPTEQFQGCQDHVHILSTPLRSLHQGVGMTWAKLSAAMLAFLCSLWPKSNPFLT